MLLVGYWGCCCVCVGCSVFFCVGFLVRVGGWFVCLWC